MICACAGALAAAHSTSSDLTILLNYSIVLLNAGQNQEAAKK